MRPFSKLYARTQPDAALPALPASMLVRNLMKLVLLLLASTSSLIMPISAQAQIKFSQETAELNHLEASVNECAAQQLISSCHAALSQTHIVQISNIHSEDPSDRIMRNAVMLLPLHMLAQLYQREGRDGVGCGYAQSGERQLHRLLGDLDRLMGQNPTAFKNVDKLKGDLEGVQAQFDKVLKECD